MNAQILSISYTMIYTRYVVDLGGVWTNSIEYSYTHMLLSLFQILQSNTKLEVSRCHFMSSYFLLRRLFITITEIINIYYFKLI
jgi:hypothetical protein